MNSSGFIADQLSGFCSATYRRLATVLRERKFEEVRP
jgi:hypothetical protein